MGWEEHLIGDEELGLASAGEPRRLWRTRVEALFRMQQKSWPALAQALRALAHLRVKEVRLDSALFLIQHNPARLTSTTARVDEEALTRRPCVLCPQHLPTQEKGISYGDYVILCNPYPILPNHLTIAHRAHIPQRLRAHVGELLDLARALSPDLFLLYNGPSCGASAPDHLHFQAAARASLPIERHLADRQLIASEHEVALFRLTSYPIPTLLLQGRDPERVAFWTERTLSILGDVTGASEEPMVNLLLFAEERADDHPVWTWLLLPRTRHRPTCFFAEEGKRLLVSPAAIDLAGVVVVPLSEHFERITADDLRRIFSEVTPAPDLFDRFIERMRADFTQS